jgi:hypothetical protein
VLDLKLLWTHPEPLPDRREPRWLFFHHKQKQLGAAVLVRGDEPKPLTIQLEPCGSVTGRLLDAGGKPWPNMEVLGRSETSYMSVTTLIWWYTSVSARTDGDGRFRVDGLIPKVKYNFSAGEKGFSLTLGPGESKDVGPLKVEEAKNR